MAHAAVETVHFSDAICIPYQVIGHLSHVIVYGVLFRKPCYVYLIVDCGFRDVDRPSAFVKSIALLGLVSTWIILVVLVSVTRPFRSIKEAVSGNQANIDGLLASYAMITISVAEFTGL